MRIIYILLLITYTSTSAQQYTISGKVVNNNLDILSGASIKIEETNMGTSSDGNGEFTLNLDKGKYTILISYTGFQSIKKEIFLEEDKKLNFILLVDDLVLDEVLVTAVRATQNTPITYSNLNKKELSKRNLGQDIPILLNYLPSVISSSDAGAGIGYTYLNVRGSNSERINVTINGIPYNDAESHGTFWVNLGDFASSTENLQLQRGVGTSTNGSGAFGASLNILTDVISEKASGEISNSFGSYNTRKHTIKFSTGKLNNHFEISGRLSKIYSDGYVNRAFSDLKSYFIQGSYSNENSLIKAISFGGSERTYQSWYGIDAKQLLEDRRQNPYTYENEVDDYNQNHYQLHWNKKLNDNWSTNLGLNYTKGSGFFEQYKTDEKAEDFNNIINDNSNVIVRRWLDNNFYVINFNATFKNKNLNLVSGLSYSNYSGDHFGEVIWGNNLVSHASIGDRYYMSDALKKDLNIFSKATYSISEEFSAYLDLQGRFVNYETAGLTSDRVPIDINTNFNFFNPKLGFIYKIKDHNSLYLSYAKAQREPNRNDFENGVSKEERLDDYELGWRYNKENFSINSNLYFMNYSNQLVLTGEIDDVGAPIRATSGNSYRLGLEIDSDIKIGQNFSIRTNAAISSNKNRDFKASINGNLENLGNTSISFSPNLIVGNILTYEANEKLQFSFLSKYVGRQYMSNLNSNITNQDVLEGYFTSDINLGYTIETKKVFTSIVINAIINNIFNKKYVDRGYYYTYNYPDNNGNIITGDGAGYYPQATTNFLIGISFKL